MLTLTLGVVAALCEGISVVDCAECAPREPDWQENLCAAFSGAGSIGGEGPHNPEDFTREELEDAVGGPDAADVVEEIITKGGPSKGLGVDPATASEAFFKGLDTACSSGLDARYPDLADSAPEAAEVLKP